MKHLQGEFAWSKSRCMEELKEFRTLLDGGQELAERQQILPFFKAHKHLAAQIGSFNARASRYDTVFNEYSFAGDVTADLIVGDHSDHAYCVVEFEDATGGSVFKSQPGRGLPEWSARFEHGFSQIVDWLWKIHEQQSTVSFQAQFGPSPSLVGLLVLGRACNLDPQERARLRWREDRLLVNGSSVYCITYDDLFDKLNTRCLTWDM